MRISIFYLFSSLIPFSLSALPQGAQVKRGQVELATDEKSVLKIHASDKAIIHFESFNIAEKEKVEFILPNQNGLVLNRVEGNNPSSIFGTLNSNGHVFLLNPYGVYFGKESRIDVGSLLASALDIQDNDFLNDHFSFFLRPESLKAKIINEGILTASPEGSIVLLAPYVENGGIINANVGNIVLAAAEQITIDFTGDGLICFASQELPPEKGISVKKARSIVQDVINADGLIFDTEMIEEGGVVRLVASSRLSGDNIIISGSKIQIEGEVVAENDFKVRGSEAICLRDKRDQPLLLHAFRDFSLESPLVDILAWENSVTSIASGRNMIFISDNPISADGRFFSGGDFSLLTTKGKPIGFISLFDPIVTSVGSVTFGTYSGPSLKVEAGGNIISTGDITITGPDAMACPPGFCMSDPDCMTLTTQSALILIAGQPPVSMSCNAVPVTFFSTMFTNPGGTGSTINLTGNLSGFETATFTGAVSLTGATVITSTAGMTFNGTIDGGFGLTLTGAGNSNTIQVTGAIGSQAPLSSLNVSGDMQFVSETIDAGLVTIGDMTTPNVNIGAVTTTTSGGMTVTATGTIQIADANVSGGGIISVNLLAPGTIINLAGNMVADGDMTIDSIGAVELYGNCSMTSNMGNISITGTTISDDVSANESLTLAATVGNVTMTTTASSNIGIFTSFTITSANSITLPGIVTQSGGINLTGNSFVLNGNITTSGGPIIVNAPLLLAGPTAISSMNAPISLLSIDGAQVFLANSGTSLLSFNGPIGATTPVTSLNATGSLIHINNNITVDQIINFIGPILLTGNSTITSAMDPINFSSTINGNFDLDLIVSNQSISISGNIGDIIPLGNFTATHFSFFQSENINANSVFLDYQSSSFGSVNTKDIHAIDSGGVVVNAGGEITVFNVRADRGEIQLVLETTGMGNVINLLGDTINADGAIEINSDNGLSPLLFTHNTITSRSSDISITASQISPKTGPGFDPNAGLTLSAAGNINVGISTSSFTAGFLNSTSGGSSIFPAITTTTNKGVVINANDLTLNGNITTSTGNGPITLNAAVVFSASLFLNAGSGIVTLGNTVTTSTSLASLNIIGSTINQNGAVSLNGGSLSYTSSLINLGDDISTNGGSVTITGNTVLNKSREVTVNTIAGTISFNGNINSSTGIHGLRLLADTALVALNGNVGNTEPLDYLRINATNINFTGSSFRAKTQIYNALNSYNFTNSNSVFLESFQDSITFEPPGVIRLAGGTNFLAETHGGNFQFPSINGTINENVDIFTGNGAIQFGNIPSGANINSVFVQGGPLILLAPVTVNSFSAFVENVQSSSLQPITTQGNTLLNTTEGTIGSLGAPIEIHSSFLIFAGAPQTLANIVGSSADNTVHAIPENQPCPLIFNGVTLATCPPPPPSPPKIPARDFYVPGIYSQYNSLASDSYFLPEVVTPEYIKLKDRLLYVLK